MFAEGHLAAELGAWRRRSDAAHEDDLEHELSYRRGIKEACESLSKISLNDAKHANKDAQGLSEEERHSFKLKDKLSTRLKMPEIMIAYPPRSPQGNPPSRRRRLTYFAEGKDKALLCFVFLFALSGGGHNLVWFIFMGKLNNLISVRYNVTTCEEQRKENDQFLFQFITSEENIWYIYYLLLVIAWVFCSCFLLDVCIRMMTYRMLKRLKLVLFARLLSLDSGWYDQNEIGHLMEQMTITMTQVESSVGSIAGESFFKVFLALIGFAGTLPLGWRLSLLLNGLMIPANLFRVVVSASLRERLLIKQTKLYGDAGTVSEETLSGISIVWAFNGQRQQAEKYNTKLDRVRRASNSAGLKIGLTRGFAEMIVMGGQSLAMWYMIKVSIDYPEQYGLEQFFSIFVTSLSSTYLMSMGMSGMEILARSRSALKSLIDIIETPSKIDPLDPRGRRLDRVFGDIEFKNVQFSYPARKKVPVLPGLSFTISRGNTYALVGESGNGKSTIVQLLLRLYDPDDGAVCLDGNNVKDLNVEWYRSQIGVVSQMPTLFSGSIKDNISGGEPHASDENIINAAKMANVHEFVMALPDQYETVVGEGGGGFSGGQKQRLAIARALYKNPRILILDEATSALDNESEKIVQKALERARMGRTTLVIAHRLSTIQDADVIVVLEKGQILEKGSHDGLMTLRGMYYALVKGQETTGLQAVPSVDNIPRESIDLPPSRLNSLRGDASGILQGRVKERLNSVREETIIVPSVTGVMGYPGRGSLQRDKLSFVSMRSGSYGGHSLRKSFAQSDYSPINEESDHIQTEKVVKRSRRRPQNLTNQMMKLVRPDCCLLISALFFVLLRSLEQPLNLFFLMSLIVETLWSNMTLKNEKN